MKEKSYGLSEQHHVDDAASGHAEEVAIKGYSVIPDVLSVPALARLRDKIDAVYRLQERDFGRQALAEIQEVDACRAPLLYDLDFVAYARDPVVLAVVQKFLGEWFILNLQNAVINRPVESHHHLSTTTSSRSA